MPRCKCCGDWIAPWWIDFVIIFVAMVLCAGFVFSACATHTIAIAPDGSMNATSTVLLYCPSAESVSLTDSTRTAETVSDSSGVGSVVNHAVEVLEP